jgi:integrase
VVTAEATPPQGLTAKFIDSLRRRDTAYELRDRRAPGLRLRVYPSGKKVFRWHASSPATVVTIGVWSMDEAPAHVTLSEARRRLELLKAAKAAGPDRLKRVREELEAQLAPRPAATGVTVAEVAQRFLRMLEGQRKRPDEARKIVERDILKACTNPDHPDPNDKCECETRFGAQSLSTLKKSDCRGLVEKVVRRGARVHAGTVLGLLKQLLDYAENVEDKFVNPAARLKARNLGVEHNDRDRWLTDTEIVTFWRALDREPLPNAEAEVDRRRTRAGIRLLLLTAVRSGELRLARWEEVDFKAETWTLPVAHQKLTPKQARQAKPFVIPLTPTALSLFGELKDLAGATPHVISSDLARDGKAYGDKAFGRAMRRLWRSHPDLKVLPEASPHDLRRTCRTWLTKLGTPPHIAERCLNHKLGRILHIYDQHDYFEERKAALLKWDVFLQRLLAPADSNVRFLQVTGEV